MGTKDQIQAGRPGNLGTNSQTQFRRLSRPVGNNLEMPVFSTIFDEKTNVAQCVQ